MVHQPIYDLPTNYQESAYYSANEPRTLFWLNTAALFPLYIFFVASTYWLAWVRNIRGDLNWGDPNLDIPVALVAIVGVLLLHEALHGLAMAWFGYKAHYGVKFASIWFLKIPMMLYATTDNGLFRRNEFVVVALTPLIGITLLGMVLGFIFPDRWHLYLALAVGLNAGGAVGDMWMTWIALRYPSSAIVRDEADSIRVYMVTQ